MKLAKLTLMSVLLGAICMAAQEVSAQAYRTKQNKTTAAPVAKFALYGKLKARAIYVTGDTIFYVEKGDNNAVMAIDRQTGEKSVVFPGIAGIYEGARPRIKKFYKVADDKIFTREGSLGVYLWDGKSVTTSPHFDKATDIIQTCGDYALLETGDGYGYDLWNVRKREKVWHHSGEGVGGQLLLVQNGTCWYYAFDYGDDPFHPVYKFGAVRIGLDGKKTFYCKSMMSQPYVQENNIKGMTESASAQLTKSGDYIYLPVYRRVYRLDTTNEDALWEEFAKVPANQAGNFGKLCINSKGDMLARRPGTNNKQEETQLYRAGHFDQPVNLGDEITTGITSPYGYNRLYVASCAWLTDAADNFIWLYRDGNEFYIYNPDGVKGYKKALGRVVE